MKRRIACGVGLLLLPLDILAGCGDDPVSTVDTVPPLAPQLEGATYEGGSVGVWWQPNTEPDLAGYFLYVIEDGVTSRANMYASLDNYVVVDLGNTAKVLQVYVTAIDFTGNESSPSQTVRAIDENLNENRDTVDNPPIEF